ILITTSEKLAGATVIEVEKQLAVLPRKEIAERSIKNSKIILVKNIDEVVEMSNEYAPEHLIISTKNYNEIAGRITNAGSLFLGYYTPESAGDYASGTNHTLPTNGYAKAYNGVNLDSFRKKITYQEITQDGLKLIGGAIEIMAENEQLFAHKNAVTLRLK
ncbi:MAG TPA: histidinol dehydrogenase, partial [Fervidobacterium sp.]|nr:histidinol dehydrogenase [Fervidobacterium sp.]